MPTIRKQVSIEAPIELVFAAFDNPGDLPLFLPGVKAVSDVELSAQRLVICSSLATGPWGSTTNSGLHTGSTSSRQGFRWDSMAPQQLGPWSLLLCPIHPEQVAQWKKQALEELPQAFSTRRAKAARDDEELTARLRSRARGYARRPSA